MLKKEPIYFRKSLQNVIAVIWSLVSYIPMLNVQFILLGTAYLFHLFAPYQRLC